MRTRLDELAGYWHAISRAAEKEYDSCPCDGHCNSCTQQKIAAVEAWDAYVGELVKVNQETEGTNDV